jgi:hypothetical protein
LTADLIDLSDSDAVMWTADSANLSDPIECDLGETAGGVGRGGPARHSEDDLVDAIGVGEGDTELEPSAGSDALAARDLFAEADRIGARSASAGSVASTPRSSAASSSSATQTRRAGLLQTVAASPDHFSD